MASNRRSTAPRRGRVGFLGTASTNASQSRFSTSSRARSRFLACERCWSTTTRMTGPNFATRRSRTSASIPRAVRRSTSASTRVWARLACCPPGPPDGPKRHRTWSTGIWHPGPVDRIRSLMPAQLTVTVAPGDAGTRRRREASGGRKGS
ncbi:uncharacterized protein METZ01_LOCUS15488 [marine metagenome]|uniref:Uncharacterized protein n=1 Tax=marine metagenome TaxID=408172 RepID=A0A381P7R1_9ZZZZ